MAREAPSTDNYFIGKGIVTFKPQGSSVAYDVGNVPEFEFTPTTENLDHFSSRGGVREKDKTIVIEKGGEIRMVMEEKTQRNLAMLLIGAMDEDADEETIDIMSENAVSGELRFYATNEVGPRWNYVFPRVDFLPSGSLSPISDEWGQMEVTGQIAAVNGSFGTATRKKAAGPYSPSNIVPPSITSPNDPPQVDDVLTANEGTWLDNPTSFTYQWMVDGVDIVGGTNKTYTVVVGDVGKAISVEVVGVNTTGSGAAATSPATADVVA